MTAYIRTAALVTALGVTLQAQTTPAIKFTETTLKNGLRVIISEDHVAPVFSLVIARSTYLVSRVASWFDSGGAGIGAVRGGAKDGNEVRLEARPAENTHISAWSTFGRDSTIGTISSIR